MVSVMITIPETVFQRMIILMGWKRFSFGLLVLESISIILGRWVETNNCWILA